MIAALINACMAPLLTWFVVLIITTIGLVGCQHRRWPFWMDRWGWILVIPAIAVGIWSAWDPTVQELIQTSSAWFTGVGLVVLVAAYPLGGLVMTGVVRAQVMMPPNAWKLLQEAPPDGRLDGFIAWAAIQQASTARWHIRAWLLPGLIAAVLRHRRNGSALATHLLDVCMGTPDLRSQVFHALVREAGRDPDRLVTLLADPRCPGDARERAARTLALLGRAVA